MSNLYKLSVGDISAPEGPEVQAQLEAIIKGLEGRDDLTDEIIAEHILQNSQDLLDASGEAEGATLLPFPVKRPVSVEFLDNNSVRITDVGSFFPFFNGESTPQWHGRSVGYLVTRSIPPKLVHFTGVNSWIYKGLRFPVGGRLVLVFYYGPIGTILRPKKIGVYVGTHLGPQGSPVSHCRGAGRFGLLKA